MAEVCRSFSHIVSFLQKKKGLSFIFFFVFCCNIFIFPCCSLDGSLAVLRFTALEKQFDENSAAKISRRDLSSAKILTDEDSDGDSDIYDKLDFIFGRFVPIGRKAEAEGIINEITIDCESEGENNKEDDKTDFTDLPKDWVGIIHYGKCSSGTREGDDYQKSVIEKMKTALLFGASAIIILSLNPKLLIKDRDVSEMFSKPIIVIESAENITTLLSILYSKIVVKVKVTINSTLEDLQKQTTFTWWTSCGWSIGTVHGREWAGVMCLDKHDTRGSKADPSSFWNFFYSALLSLMLLFIVKAKRRNGEWRPADQDMELSLRRLAVQAVSLMKTKRYRGRDASQGIPRDMCAICLEFFMIKQKIRVLPCLHEFHTYCVDAWLVNNRTCPLCKLNILGHIEKC